MADFTEVELVGREIVKSVNAILLANITNDLVKKYEKQGKRLKYLIRCREKLEITRKSKRNEDEGFESENDSVISNEDSYLVDDHVLKCTVGSTDSANSSASSDTDETEQIVVNNESKEQFDITDVIFCHTESRFPNIIAWVVKRDLQQNDELRLSKTGVENMKSALEVIVTKCKNNESLRELCFNYKERSRRFKLERGYRRNVPENKKVSLDDIKVTNSTLIKSSLLKITNKTINVDNIPKLSSSVSLNSIFIEKPEEKKVPVKPTKPIVHRYNLVQRTDNDVTHIEILHDSKSKLRREIEGIILTDVDVGKKDHVRQQESETPPIRPERRRYVRKKDSMGENNVLEEKSELKLSYPKIETVNGALGSWRNENDIRKRSKSVDRLQILQKKTPMAYRYIDITDYKTNSRNNKMMKEQRRRRNSLDELIVKSKTEVNLKPVIKKNKKIKNSEPKKVTFSAFATVQVVD